MADVKDYRNIILKQAYAFPDENEMEVAVMLVDNGARSVLFLERVLISGANTPDLLLAKQFRWEIKTPIKFGEDTLKHAFRAAVNQSENVIFYLKYNKIPDKNVIRTLERLFPLVRRAKRLKIVLKSGKVLDFTK
jgi:hypothetical protein